MVKRMRLVPLNEDVGGSCGVGTYGYEVVGGVGGCSTSGDWVFRRGSRMARSWSLEEAGFDFGKLVLFRLFVEIARWCLLWRTVGVREGTKGHFFVYTNLPNCGFAFFAKEVSEVVDVVLVVGVERIFVWNSRSWLLCLDSRCVWGKLWLVVAKSSFLFYFVFV